MKIGGTSLEPLFIWKKKHSIADAVDFATSVAATLARLGSGAYVAHIGNRPAKLLELYEREVCPFSRKVREALSILDLDAIVHPCAPEPRRFRSAVEGYVGKFQIPLLVDPNTSATITDSDAIVRYLFRHYGDGQVPLPLRMGPLTDASSKFASLLRKSKAAESPPTKEPDDLLELYSYEASPYCRLVRETLMKWEVPYIVHNVARGSPKRGAFVERTGKMQLPYLVDKARGIEMFESRAIKDYIEDHFGSNGHRH
ncbi:glutathione S-transferase N-terminal domain-containing protein [Pendulispora brunnea]|uniref:Glutathione S-transferase N-terminal domain-containing protein n=1 Tax=Pendulispora brunnea TaxID=2905690 RepID=A0ABZ2K9S0_9BACT